MMAQEATPQQSVEATATPAALPSEDGSHDVDNTSRDPHPAPELNGDPSANVVVDKLVNDLVDEVVNSAEVSVSGSDTEASRSRKDDKGHVRSSSVKRPTTFKSVSVNKTFLASKGSSASVAPKAGEKPAATASSTATPPSASSTPKPRLVAKTGSSSLRDASKTSAAPNGRPPPDGNVVWNKNRPVPPPDPKKYSDEELSKLGIHMANRLHPDDAKGQSTWADIDEDDEDWAAPEAITWTDGTKTTLHVDEPANEPVAEHASQPVSQSASQPAILPEPPVVTEHKPVDKPRSPAPFTGSPSVRPSTLPSGKGLILKGAPEKPTLVAKPPAPPTPVKSPWAQLPPIKKASPMEVQPEQLQRGFPPPSHAYGPKGTTPPAAREINADDFSRSPRRDHRELFNSHSGRYEPVPERRGMPRTDLHPRQPALLQRPLHPEGPAEPSAAFQTSHTSGSYGRRRGSSNVSGGSGSFSRIGRPFEQALPPHEMLDPRRGSFTASDHPTSPRNFSPSDPHTGPRQPSASPWQHLASPAMSHAALQVPASVDMTMAPPPPAPMQDDVEFQKKLMKERREEAIRRRQEEEAREEAAKKERLRKKLEALGPAPERKSEKKEPVNETPDIPATQSDEPSQQDQLQHESKDTKPITTTPAAVVDNKQDSLPNGVRPESQTPAKSPSAPEQLPAPENKHAHPWQPRAQNQPEGFPSWGLGRRASANVWASPSNDRSLGNGTFNAVPPTQPSQLPQIQGSRPGPGPIAPPSRATSQHSQPAPIAPPQRSGPRSHVQDEPAQRRNKWSTAVLAGDEEIRMGRQRQQSHFEAEMKARGLDYADMAAPINEQWKPAKEDDKGQRILRDAVNWVHGSNAQNSTSWNPSSYSVGSNGSATGGSQHSRFFPPSRDLQEADSPARETERSHSPSPPPPDMDGHPAFDGDAAHPHVSLPRTKPIVKLPPAAPSAPTATQRSGQPSSAWPSSSLTQGQSSRSAAGVSSAVSNETSMFWQNRIKNLLSDNSQNPSSVDSSSKTTLAQPSQRAPATVSLPGVFAPSIPVGECSFATKTMDEDCFEEQEMGSLPPVHLPTQVPDAAWEPAKPPPRQDRRLKEVVTTSAEALVFTPESRSYFILFPNMVNKKTVAMPLSSRSPSNPGRRGRGSRYASGTSYRGGNRNRDSTEQSSAERSTFSRGGRGSSYRGRSEGGWARSASTPIQTQ
ncbi:hypothetical protein VP1G_02578 [Cytospora mali]|uniref:Uncharacterized protein n=1 Tax=Cytospora mali TaxID=578113 RepID=A0A194UTS8_CYTMA|nr:hypothetical protein VP1G_02578 [Valsa mali var. pyri (nom. inval.)]